MEPKLRAMFSVAHARRSTTGEDIGAAAAREAWEETGVVASVEGVLAVRQAHGMAFTKSDMFFCIGMRTKGDGSGEDLKPCVSCQAVA